MDLTTLSIAELRDLEKKIPKELKRRESKEMAKALNEVKAVAERLGYSLDQLVGKEGKASTRGPKAGGKVAVKYRHPKKPELEWTGRGRQPKWVQEWLTGGGKLDALNV